MLYHQVSWLIIVLLIVNYWELSRSGPDRVEFVIPAYSHYTSETKSNKYHTLNDWISNGSTKLFANNMKVVLYSGVHEIQFNLSMSYILITDINSFMMTGENRHDTLITCSRRFYFHFISVRNIKLSNFTIINCTYILNDVTYWNMSFFVLYQTAYIGNTKSSIVFSDSDNITKQRWNIYFSRYFKPNREATALRDFWC